MILLEHLRESIVAVLCKDGADPASILAERKLASLIDSLQIVEIVDLVEESLGGPIPQSELTDENFNSVDSLLAMAQRLATQEKSK
jgi:acyl carrier protein